MELSPAAMAPSPPARELRVAATAEQHQFCREGDYWSVAFDGRTATSRRSSPTLKKDANAATDIERSTPWPTGECLNVAVRLPSPSDGYPAFSMCTR